MIKIKYFARLGEALRSKEEDLEFDGDNVTVADLVDLLRGRGEPWTSQFSSQSSVLMALNHEMCDAQASLKPGDEIGFFPPVTGG
ncbi:MAG: molybdopterin synthase sulfur carrier subunit [Gammaproteobacteria bacterium]|jgi:molybdopterin synthase sulfur carrier subunit